jgi:hypothetical protein
VNALHPSAPRRARRLAVLALVLVVPVAAGCTVATNQPDDYDATTEANVLDGFVRQQMEDPGDAPIIYVIEEGSEEGEVFIPEGIDPNVLADAQCVYAGITDEDTGIDFDDWKALDSALGDDPQAVADSAADTPEAEATPTDEAYLRLVEIQTACATPS